MKRNLKSEDMIWPFIYFNLLANLKFLNKNNLYVYVQRGKVSYCAVLEKMFTPPWKADRFQYIIYNLSRCWEARDFFFIKLANMDMKITCIWHSKCWQVYMFKQNLQSMLPAKRSHKKVLPRQGKAFHSNNILLSEQRQSIKLTQKPQAQLHLPT